MLILITVTFNIFIKNCYLKYLPTATTLPFVSNTVSAHNFLTLLSMPTGSMLQYLVRNSSFIGWNADHLHVDTLLLNIYAIQYTIIHHSFKFYNKLFIVRGHVVNTVQ